jgi:AcrR family transcriptional regulator
LSREIAPLRADAQRSRARVLKAADTVFNARGAAASTDEVARVAGVGVATVFRHFPTKQALLEAVVRARLDALVAAGRELAMKGEPEGFYTLFARLIDGSVAKRAIGDVLLGGSEAFRTTSYALAAELWACFDELMATAKAAGVLRPDLDTDDLQAILAGVHQSLLHAAGDRVRQARIADVVLRGLRP